MTEETLIYQIPLDLFFSSRPKGHDTLDEITNFIQANKEHLEKAQTQSSRQNSYSNPIPGQVNRHRLQQRGRGGPPSSWFANAKNNLTSDEILYNNFNSTLNKLSASNIDLIIKEIQTLNILTEDHLNKFADTLFSKAIGEEKFSFIYAELTHKLSYMSITTDVDGVSTIIFLKDLIDTKCTQMFTQCITLAECMINKTSSLGCMAFYGELYLKNLVNQSLIISNIQKLVDIITFDKSHLINCLNSILKVVDKKLNSSNDLKKSSEPIYNKINDLITSGKLMNKDKFTLMKYIK